MFNRIVIQHGASRLAPTWPFGNNNLEKSHHDTLLDHNDGDIDAAKESFSVEAYTYKPSLAQDMMNCSVLVCSGGAGTLLEALELEKCVVVVPNTTLQDNHQLEIVHELQRSGYISSCPLLYHKDSISAVKSRVVDHKSSVESLIGAIRNAVDTRGRVRRKRWGPPKADICSILQESLL